ncbi:MAG: hypothetical protein QG573_757 [Acidobacteriota bacterium]|nr:hypothetical protein [Acidobacteriota bacterium]
MRDFEKWQAVGTCVVCALLGPLLLPAAGLAGTGRLVSPWVNRAPRIDGQLTAGEWNAAKLVDLGAGVSLLIENDARTLYLAVLDSGDLTLGSGDEFVLLFDDEGGAAPILDDNLWDGALCQATPELGEGFLDFGWDQNVTYREYSGGYCSPQLLNDRATFRAAAQPQGVTYEIALPLDGPMPLSAAAGQRFAVWLVLYRDAAQVACLPNCGPSSPADFRNVVLASGGCNTGPQDFGSGDPLVGLPLDWTSENTTGGGPGWVQAPPAQFGDPVFCQANDTGGAGGAACIANFFCTAPRTDSLLRMPLALEGMTAATVRVRGVLQVAGPHEYLDFGIRRLDTSGNSLLFWLDENRNETVELSIPVAGSPPVEFWFTHSTFSDGGVEGGYAQVDDVELTCGPRIFADGFESGLTTHWSADSP